MTGMLSAALLAATLQPSTAATRYDMGERLIVLETVWMDSGAEAKRRAVPHITAAVGSFFTQRFGEACRSLDLALAALEGRAPRPEDAMTVRFSPPYAAPGGKAVAKVTWAYTPASSDPVSVAVGGRRIEAAPGQNAEISLNADDLREDREGVLDAGLLVPVEEGAHSGFVHLAIVSRLEERTAALEASANPDIQQIGSLVRRISSGRAEQDASILAPLALGEELLKGRAKPESITNWPSAREGATVLRAAFPERMSATSTLVVALHGAGGSENLFFEGYGRGLAVAESLRRGWAIIAPRSSQSAVADSIAWFTRVRGAAPARVVVMGHSMGGALALLSGASKPSPAAVVLFAPAGSRIPAELANTPMFIGVGRQELPMLAASASQLKSQAGGRADAVFREFDPCEHLMIVAEALPGAFEWLDRTLGKN